jgi:hypothetical protein
MSVKPMIFSGHALIKRKYFESSDRKVLKVELKNLRGIYVLYGRTSIY